MDTISQVLIDLFKNNHDIIHMQLKEITHYESLIKPPFRGNCMNWVVGHILGVRGDCLEVMGLPGTLNDDEVKIYGYGSEPLTDTARACDLNIMEEKLDKSLERIVNKLGSLSPVELDQKVQIWRGTVTLIEALSFMQWHESYHTGQLELLRQLAGKNDKVI
jgi:hypothetical protein